MNTTDFSNAKNIRLKAEKLHQSKVPKISIRLTEAANLELIQELEVHQIELEMQQRELLFLNGKETAAKDEYTELYDFAPIGYFSLNKEGNIIKANLYAAKMLHLVHSTLANRKFILLIAVKSKVIFNLFLNKLFTNSSPQYCELTVLTNSNTPQYIQLSGIASQTGEYCLITAVDITLIKHAAAVIESDKRRLATILVGMNAGTWEWNINNGNIIFNERWAEMIGYTLTEISPLDIDRWKHFLHPDDLDCFNDLLQKHFTQKLEYYSCEVRMKHKEGHWVWVNTKGSVNEWDTEGDPLCMSGTNQDISKEKNLEKKLFEAERFSTDIVNALPFEICILDETGAIITVNTKWVEFEKLNTLLPTKIGVGANYLEVCDATTGVDATYAKSIAKGIRAIIDLKQSVFSLEYPCCSPTNDRWFNAIITRFEGKGPVRIVVSLENITERKNAAITKQIASDLINKVADRVPGVVYQFKMRPNGSFCFPFASEAINQIFRVTPEEVNENADKVFAIIHPNDYSDFVASIRTSARELTLWQHNYRVQFADGTVRNLYGNAMPQLETDESVLWYGFTTDVTESKKRDEKIRQLSKAVEQSPVTIVITDTGGKIEYVNPTFEIITGYSSKEAIGKNLLILQSGYTTEAQYKDMWATLHAGDTWQGEFYNVKKNGDHYWESAKISPILNATGNTTQYLAIKEDITNRKLAEEKLKTFAAELQTSNTDLENFAYVASHDLQEPLRMITGFLKLLVKRLGSNLDPDNKKFIEFAVDGAARMSVLINDLLQYSRTGTNKEAFAVVNLNEVLAYNCLLLKSVIDQNDATIVVKPLPEIVGNKTLINELFVNLLSNALKYRGPQKPIIEVGYIEENSRYVFYIKDNGIGINEKYYDKIFVIFQRLHGKGEYSGTGIGLALCKKIVETHKGKIWVASQPGKGSCFYFSIPKVAGK